jgi:hypothetical protein
MTVASRAALMVARINGLAATLAFELFAAASAQGGRAFGSRMQYISQRSSRVGGRMPIYSAARFVLNRPQPLRLEELTRPWK